MYDSIPPIQWYDIGKEFVCQQWDIVCDAMSAWYKDDNEVFDSFSLRIAGGKKTALVWVSWSGKTTLVKLIAGYLKPTKWAVYVDDQNLSEVALKSYYQHVGYLTQDPSVFDGTVRENLTFALDSGTIQNEELQEKVKRAITQAKCEFIYDFPQWRETEIGERWVRLSGWQRQRLAIAKIFLKDPHIVILDEPTSALDSFSEDAITQAMHNLFEWRTVIIVAHRLQTVKQADDIILLENGQVQERGTHQQLVQQWGKYAKMLELQSGF
jgi:ABC-type multidrug transport system fused ATPase/permease subunit